MEEEHRASEQKLLRNHDIDDNYDVDVEYSNPKGRWRSVRQGPVLIHTLLVTLYTVIFIALLKSHVFVGKMDTSLVYSPVRDIVTKQVKILDASVLHTNDFKGPPRPKLDEAWGSLLMNANIRVSEDMLQQANKSSIPLEDGSGYYAILDVYHQLHCLKYIRHYIHDDYYHDTKPWTPTHIDHCIDSIRQNLMCNADTSLMTFRWVDDDPLPKPNFMGKHECVNWESIEEWAAERSFNPDDPTLLHHPSQVGNAN